MYGNIYKVNSTSIFQYITLVSKCDQSLDIETRQQVIIILNGKVINNIRKQYKICGWHSDYSKICS